MNDPDPNSREDAKARRRDEEALSAMVVDCGYRLHVEAGPGLLESVYEAVLARMLSDQGLAVRRQVPVPIDLLGLHFDEGFRVDLLIEDKFLVELKSVEKLAPVHAKQTLTYLRLLRLPLGLLINFGAPTFKEGVQRIVNQHTRFAPSREPISSPMNDPDPNSREDAKARRRDEWRFLLADAVERLRQIMHLLTTV